MQDAETKRGILHRLVVRVASINRHLALLFLCTAQSFKLTLLFTVSALFIVYINKYDVINMVRWIVFLFVVIKIVYCVIYALAYRKDMLPKTEDVDIFSKQMIERFKKII